MSAPAWLEAIRARCAAATKGTWTYGRLQSTSKDEMIAYLINCVEVSPLTDAFYLVGAEDREADVCHTGNGPTSERNAEFIAHARADLPAVLGLLEDIGRGLEEMRDQPHLNGTILERLIVQYAAGPRGTRDG